MFLCESLFFVFKNIIIFFHNPLNVTPLMKNFSRIKHNFNSMIFKRNEEVYHPLRSNPNRHYSTLYNNIKKKIMFNSISIEQVLSTRK